MGKIRFIIPVLIAIILGQDLGAQGPYKREIRAVWVASVTGADWPKAGDRGDVPAMKAELIRMLDLYEAMNMNAIFLQVRPECDALYQSAHEPWSRFLTGTQGQDPGFDPLAFAIEESRKRGIELHAWLNPYRINATVGMSYHPSHVYSEHPEWALKYDNGKYILNPGRPEVMSYIGDVVRDLVGNYELDGVHFDDYFYAYGGTENSLDQAEYDQYGNGMSRGDWRRDNVNRMIDTVYRAIRETDPSVRFGVSPFGIYRPGIPPGITGMDAYNDIYCDPLAWLEDGNVDYLSPQLYWPTGGGQDFETLVNWWSEQVEDHGRHLYAGMGIYRMEPSKKGSQLTGVPGDAGLHENKAYFNMNLSLLEQSLLKSTSDPVAPWTPGQVGLQIDLIRANHAKGALGSVFYRAHTLDIVEGLADYLKQEKFIYPTLAPEMTWKTDDTPLTPQNLRIEIVGNDYFLLWDNSLESREEFAIYVSDGESDADGIILVPGFLQGTTRENQAPLADMVLSSNSWITVTAVSATGREGLPAPAIEVDVDLPLAELVSPEDGLTLGQDDKLQWGSSLTEPEYQLQAASNASFSNVVFESGWTTETDTSLAGLELEGERTYHWRVRAREDATGPWSASRSFTTGYPSLPELTYPGNVDGNINTKPVIRWTCSAATEEILVEISQTTGFEDPVATQVFPAGPKQGLLDTELEKDTWYYIRIKGSNTYGSSEFTEMITFRTTAGSIPDVILLGPEQDAIVSSWDELLWTTNTTEGSVTYLLEVAIDEAFTGMLYRSGWREADRMLIDEMGLEGQRDHYWRVKARNEFGESEYSSTGTFTTGFPTRPGISAPPHLTDGVSAKPLVVWTTDAETDSVYIEFARSSDFETISYAETMDASTGSGQISGSLRGYTWYYVHLRALNEFGQSVFSAVRYFGTGEGTSIIDAGSSGKLEIHPSPLTSGRLNIRCPADGSSDGILSICSLSGQILMERSVEKVPAGEFHFMLHREEFPAPGLYFITFSSGKRVYRSSLPVL